MTGSHTSQPKKSSKIYKTLRLLLLASVIQIILLGVFASNLGGDGTSTVAKEKEVNVPSKAPGAAAAAPTIDADMDDLIDDDSIKGDKDAPVTIVEFSDYECPFCTRFYTQTYLQLKTKYIDTGKVKFVYRDFPLGFHANAKKSAEAAECAVEQVKFFEMHDILFEKGVKGGIASYKQFAKDIGLDSTKFDTCLDSGEMADEVQKDFLDGQKLGISGTPGFIINGQIIKGAQPFPVFQQIIEAELAK